MGRGPTKSNENVYFVARKKAAMYNERLYSREGAAELLGISVSTLADYELGNTKVVPVDKVVLMADLYNAPELKTGYCKYECPICSYLPVATEAKGLEGIALRLMKRLDCDELNCNWGDGVLEDTEAEYQRRWSMVVAGKLKTEAFLAWYFGCSEEEAKNMMPEPVARFPTEE